MKKLLAIILALIMILSFAACDSTEKEDETKEKHEHSFKTDWSKDNAYHWHECSGENCNEISNKAEHIWNDGEDKSATEKIFTCTVCSQTKTEPIVKVTTVTEAEWKAAFALTNATANGFLVENGEKETVLFKIDKTVYYSELEDYIAWVTQKDGIYYMYNNQNSEENRIGESFTINVSTILMSFHLPEYSKFTYSEETKSYICTNEDYPDEYYKFNLYFENGLLVKFESTNKSNEINYSFNFSDYGTTKIELPKQNNDTPSGTTIEVTQAEWNAMKAAEKFNNVTFTNNATFVSGYSEVGPHVNIFKLAGNKATADGTPMEAESIDALRTMYLGTSLAIVENFEKFSYDANQKCYVSVESISYNVSLMGYDAAITVKDAIVELDANKNLAKITCEMTQEFVDQGTPKKYVLNVIFTFENYGTTIVE